MDNDGLITLIREKLISDQNISGLFTPFFENERYPHSTLSEFPYFFLYMQNLEETLEEYLRRYPIFNDFEGIRNVAEYMIRTNDLELLGWLAQIHVNIHMTNKPAKYYSLPEITMKGTAFVDLASGADFINFLDSINQNEDYYAVDVSVFACECVRYKSQLLGLDKIHVINKSIKDLKKSDIEGEIGIIRAKNIFTYVTDYLNYIQAHYEWLSVGGVMIFQEQANNSYWQNNFNLVMSKIQNVQKELCIGSGNDAFTLHSLYIYKN